MKEIKVVLLLIVLFTTEYGFAMDLDNTGFTGSGALSVGLEINQKINKNKVKLEEYMGKLKAIVKDNANDKNAEAYLDKLNSNWVNYIKSECALIGLTSDAASNSWSSVQIGRCESNLYEQRIINIKKTIKCINSKLNDNNINSNPLKCLYNIMPFNVKSK
jgi:uncharacterized protein YecT (DUF1311 family)